jgi:hypothetical protein
MKKFRHCGSPSASRSAPVRSYMLTTVTSEVSMKVESRLFTKLGMTSTSACGRTTRRWICHQERPSEAAASTWPLGRAWSPPRTTSAM